MAQQFRALNQRHKTFIARQKIFFVATATADSRVNVSPKGMDCLRILDNQRVIWLNLTGSGNETAAHLRSHPRMTLMFCAFEGSPLILRLYGTARVLHANDPGWKDLLAKFPPLPGARQIFDLTLDLVQTSCGMAVPRYDYISDREELTTWSAELGSDGMRQYQKKYNRLSIDGLPTGLDEENN